jgi:spore maturation protein CgeB
MSSPRPSTLRSLRRTLWHLRHGGVQQARKHLRRARLGLDAGPAPRPLEAAPGAPAPASRRSSPFGARAGVSPGGAPAGYTLDFLPAEPTDRPRRFADVTVATILDDFSELAWGYEFTTVALTPQGWREDLQRHRIDLLLVESAWAGSGKAWQYQLTGSKAPSEELRALVARCRELGIPAVFWNKEDPPHFEDFLDTARLFDAVFTSDSRLIERYREALGHERVAPLPFAAQDAMHNPIRPQWGFHERDVAFAGMYFAHKFPERREQMDLLLGAAEEASRRMPTGLEIFSRFLGDDERYQFPEPYDRRVVGGLPYAKMLTAYKGYKAFLNVNSVTESPSMCARRVFEITASGTPVVTTRSEAIPRFFTENQVPVVDTPEQARDVLRSLVRSPELNDRTVHLAQRTIWRHHTYSHRAVDVLRAAGLEHDAGGLAFAERLRLPSVSALVSTNRPHQLEHVIRTVGAFQDVETELVLLTHGFEPARGEVARLAREAGIADVRILHAEPGVPLGACLNRLVDAAAGEVMTKVDDDDLYGPQYLADLLRALRFSGADVVGKQAHYMHLKETDATLLRFAEREHRWTDFVMGPTITGTAETFRTTPFAEVSRGEDSNFLVSVLDAGGRIYSADRFNFCQMRHSAEGGHAWAVEDREILASGELKYYGLNTAHMMT